MKKGIKKIVKLFLNEKQIYSLRMMILKFMSFKKNIITDYSIESFGDADSDTFFGYYDISPFNTIGNEIVYLSKRKEEQNADIIIRNTETKNIKILGFTKAWNWQQGARLRWVPNAKNQIMYNDFQDNKYITKILGLDNSQTRTLSWPIYDIDNEGKFGITLNFARLGILRPGYGYTNIPYKESNLLADEGIGLVDIKNNSYKKIVTYEMIEHFTGEYSVDYHKCYINHLSFSPSGDKFLFFWIRINDNGMHQASLLVFDIKKEKLILLERELSVSHYEWVEDESIIITAYDYERRCSYYKYNINGEKEVLLPNLLTKDGHPTWLGNNEIITDTYLDKFGYQKILYVNIQNNTLKELIDIYSTYKCFGEKRCDLHPRVNKKNNEICFDANVEGNRKIYLLKGWR